jgi:hypothetical protein
LALRHLNAAMVAGASLQLSEGRQDQLFLLLLAGDGREDRVVGGGLSALWLGWFKSGHTKL